MRSTCELRSRCGIVIALGSGSRHSSRRAGIETADPSARLHRRRAVGARDRPAARRGCRRKRDASRRGALLARAQPVRVRRSWCGGGHRQPARARLSVEHVGEAGAVAADRDRGAAAAQRRAVAPGHAATPTGQRRRQLRPSPPRRRIATAASPRRRLRRFLRQTPPSAVSGDAQAARAATASARDVVLRDHQSG